MSVSTLKVLFLSRCCATENNTICDTTMKSMTIS